METIFALATAPGRAGVAVIRVSGDRAKEACQALTGGVPQDRRASLRRLVDGDVVIDQALVLVFSQGESFTGEDVVEFQTHGSPAVIARLLQALSRQDGLRSAEPGEFTRRALENGRMTLAEVEGLADLLAAETEAQRQQAFRTFGGAFGARVEEWRKRLLRAAALIEATIDFVDEDVPVDVAPEVVELIRGLIRDFEREISGVGAAERVRSGFEVAIVGAPNVGKSTLLNRLAGREAAITSEFAGTTRDIIEVRMDIDGIPVTFLDTAGIRRTDDHVEAIGVERALQRANAADIRVCLGDAGEGLILKADDLVLIPKSDLMLSAGGKGISGMTGQGVGELLEHVGNVLAERVAEAEIATRVRHAEALAIARQALNESLEHLDRVGSADELVAEGIRAAIRGLDSLVGRIGVDDVLGEIFSSFCIGK